MNLIDPDRSDSGRGSSRRRELAEEETSGRIIGAFYHVYTTLGFGFLESVYVKSLEITLTKLGLFVQREVLFDVFFEGERVGTHRADMIVERKVVVEVKASHTLADFHQRQLLNYLTALDLDLGMLLHFGPNAKFYRVLGRRRPRRARSDPG